MSQENDPAEDARQTARARCGLDDGSVVLTVASILTTGGLLAVVLSTRIKFSNIFADFQAELPLLTDILRSACFAWLVGILFGLTILKEFVVRNRTATAACNTDRHSCCHVAAHFVRRRHVRAPDRAHRQAVVELNNNAGWCLLCRSRQGKLIENPMRMRIFRSRWFYLSCVALLCIGLAGRWLWKRCSRDSSPHETYGPATTAGRDNPEDSAADPAVAVKQLRDWARAAVADIEKNVHDYSEVMVKRERIGNTSARSR